MGENRKPRPLRTDNGLIMRIMEQKIKDKKFQKREIKRELNKLIKQCVEINGGTLTGINYEYDKVKGGLGQLDFITLVNKIDGLRANLNKLNAELNELIEKRKKFIEIVKSEKDIEKKVFYYREILEYSQTKTAEKIGYSVRQIQRIEKKLKQK